MEHAIGLGGRLRACRRAKGVSAAALAARVGVTENAIRKIESGDSKEPRFSTGLRIARALGVDPNELIASSSAHASPPRLPLVLRHIRECRSKLAKLGVAHVSVFGSVARGEETSSSDIDVLIEPNPSARFTLLNLASAQEILEQVVGMRVDVVTAGMLSASPAGRAAQKEAVRAF